MNSLERDLLAAQQRLAARLADRTPCVVCGGEATQCIAGPPMRWLCADDWQAELVEMRRAAQDRLLAEQQGRAIR